MEGVALDLDRVLFDTDAYVEELRKRLAERGLSFDDIVREAMVDGRRDICRLYEIASRRIGDAGEVFFSGMGRFVPPSIREVVGELKRRARVFVVTVGCEMQRRKIEELGLKVFVVDNAEEKISRVKELGAGIFIDDKREIVERAREEGINAWQAVWFLRGERRKNLMEDALTDPFQLLELVK